MRSPALPLESEVRLPVTKGMGLQVRFAAGGAFSEHEGGSQVGCGHALPIIALI